MRDKVLLINPNLMKPPVSPVALDYLANALENAGFQAVLLDLTFSNNVDADIESTLKQDFLLVGISIRNIDDSYMASKDFCLERTKSIIATIASHTNAPLVLGGIGYSIFPLAVQDYCGVSFGVIGDGEGVLPLLARRLSRGKPYDDIPGLIYRAADGMHTNAPVTLDLARQSLSSREFVDNERYLREGGMVGFETKRGCEQRCVYCADPLGKGKKMRLRPPSDIALELKRMAQRGIDTFHTCDSEFNLPKAHAGEVCRELIRTAINRNIRWYAYCSPQGFSGDTAYFMQKAGCAGIDFGVDSGSTRMLKILARDFVPEDLKHAAQLCHTYAITFMFDLLLGAPGETRETLQESIELMKSLEPDRVGISFGVRIYPNTPLARFVRKQGFTPKNPNLHGAVENNETMLRPVYYCESTLGDDVLDYLDSLIGGDKRFLIGSKDAVAENYNYNDNTTLVQAIRKGYRGAFWDILRRYEQDQHAAVASGGTDAGTGSEAISG
jgi:radical SAM superfamily enzyme YgiQ (UPF0313 family)